MEFFINPGIARIMIIEVPIIEDLLYILPPLPARSYYRRHAHTPIHCPTPLQRHTHAPDHLPTHWQNAHQLQPHMHTGPGWGGDRFSKNLEIFSKNVQGGQFILLSPPCPPPWFCFRGRTIFHAEGGTRVGLGGWGGTVPPCPPPCMHVWLACFFF